MDPVTEWGESEGVHQISAESREKGREPEEFVDAIRSGRLEGDE